MRIIKLSDLIYATQSLTYLVALALKMLALKPSLACSLL